MERVSNVRLATLVFDFNIYPRHKVDQYHVKEMCDSLLVGNMPPPIIVERKTKRVVDGFHRTEAYRKVFGLDGKIPAIVKEWPDEASMMLEAVASNSTHGRALTPQDRVRCIALLEQRGLQPDQMATALCMTPQKITEMKATRIAQYNMEPVVLKRSAAHLAGQELSSDEMEYNTKAGGLNQTFYVNQVIAMLDKDTVNWENNVLVGALRKLHEVLEQNWWGPTLC